MTFVNIFWGFRRNISKLVHKLLIFLSALFIHFKTYLEYHYPICIPLLFFPSLLMIYGAVTFYIGKLCAVLPKPWKHTFQRVSLPPSFQTRTWEVQGKLLSHEEKNAFFTVRWCSSAVKYVPVISLPF